MTEYFKKINLQGAALNFELSIDHSKYSPLAYHVSTALRDEETSKITISGVSPNINNPGRCSVDSNGTETRDPETALSENHTLHTATKLCPQQAQECQVGSHLSYLKPFCKYSETASVCHFK